MKENPEILGAARFSDILCDIYNTEKSEIKLIQQTYT